MSCDDEHAAMLYAGVRNAFVGALCAPNRHGGGATPESPAVAEGALGASRERLRELSAQVSEQLACGWSDGDDEVDVRWRAVWQLRTHLEEIWEVQSRAESRARALREREETLRSLDAATYWWPSAALRRLFDIGMVGAGLASLWLGMLRLPVYAAPLAGVTVVLMLVRVVLHYRARWARVVEQRRDAQRDRLRLETARLRGGCDADWARAATLTDAIQTGSARVGLPDPVTPEAVEACEQQLAVELRTHGADTPLTQQLLELLETQDDEPRRAAALADATTERQQLDGEWATWLGDAGLPGDIDVEGAEDWVGEVDRIAAARAARDVAAQQLGVIEPEIAAWENDTRQLLEGVGVAISPMLCGSALAAKLSALASRVRDEEEQHQRCTRLNAELHAAEQQQIAAERELASARAARRALLDAAGAGDEAALRGLVDGVRASQEARARLERLQASIDAALSGFDAASDPRAQLACGEIERWVAACEDCEARLEQTRERLAQAAQRRRAAEQRLDAARSATRVADLRLEREQVLAQLAAVSRSWKLRMLAAALLDRSLQEYTSVESRELLRSASERLAALSRGRFTAILRMEKSVGFVLLDAAGQQMAVDAQLGTTPLTYVYLSLVLARAADLAGRGTSMPVVLDDALAPLSLDEARAVAQELARCARVYPVVYVTTEASRARVLAAMPAEVTIIDALPA